MTNMHTELVAGRNGRETVKLYEIFLILRGIFYFIYISTSSTTVGVCHSLEPNDMTQDLNMLLLIAL